MTEPDSSYVKIFFVLASYWVVSISMVFANKYLVGDKLSTTDVAIFVAWIQCIVTVIVCIAAVKFRQIVLHHTIALPSMQLSLLLNKNLVLLYCFYTGMLIGNNYCLKFVGVAFFQVARSLALIFTVCLSMVFLKQKITWRIVGCCLIVVSGFGLGVDQEKLTGNLSVKGVIFGVMASCFIALNGIFTKRVLDITKNNTLYNVFYMNLGCVVLMIPFVLITNQISSALTLIASDPYFVLLVLMTSLLGFVISFMGTLVINVTSPTTHHISNNSRSVFQTILAVIAYDEYKTGLWWCSIGLVITGALLYTYTRNREIEAEKNAKLSLIVEKEPV